MPFPILLAIPILLSMAGYGAKKGFDSKKMNDEAHALAEKAKQRHERSRKALITKTSETNNHLVELGKLKVTAFTDCLNHLVKTLRRMDKRSSSALKDFDVEFSVADLKQIDIAVANALEISKGLGSGASAGALAALGAYGTVGMLASASTGTAIATLSGAAATNATLAFLGGGALAAGGAGVVGGMAVLGGIVIAPALAIGGFVLASKAEKTLTDAKAYEAKLDVAIADMSKSAAILRGIDINVAELARVIMHLAVRYERVKTEDVTDEKSIVLMLKIGKALKATLDQQVMKSNGAPTSNIKLKIKGFMEL